MRFVLLASLASMLAVSAWGCGEDPAPAAQAPTIRAPAAGIVVTRAAADLPAGCDPASVAELVGEFAAALNVADLDRLQELLAPPSHEPPMTVYVNGDGEYDFMSFTDSLETDAGDGMFYNAFGPAEIDSHVESRYAQHDRLRLLGVQVFGDSVAPHAVSGSFAFERTADDLPDYGSETAIAFGTYGMNCGTRTIFLWAPTVDSHGGQPTLVPCKKPAGWTVDVATVLACS